MNTISIDSILVDYVNTEITISDIFIDNCSFQEMLKKTFSTAFSKGRFKEFFIPILGRDSTDKLNFGKELYSNLIPNENEQVITPIYGCHDDCCVYLFLKISNKNNTIFWEGIGRNSNYIFDKQVSKDSIDWLPDFTPYQFEINNYKKIINQLN